MIPWWVWPVGWLALVVLVIVVLSVSGRERDRGDALAAVALDLPPEPGMVKYGATWVHADCWESLRLGYPGLDCCRGPLWGEDMRGASKPFWPAGEPSWNRDPTPQEREAIMREIDRVWWED